MGGSRRPGAIHLHSFGHLDPEEIKALLEDAGGGFAKDEAGVLCGAFGF
jgi:hypothetical protein